MEQETKLIKRALFKESEEKSVWKNGYWEEECNPTGSGTRQHMEATGALELNSCCRRTSRALSL